MKKNCQFSSLLWSLESSNEKRAPFPQILGTSYMGKRGRAERGGHKGSSEVTQATAPLANTLEDGLQFQTQVLGTETIKSFFQQIEVVVASGQLSWVYSCFASLKQHEAAWAYSESGPRCLKSVIFSSLCSNTLVFLHFTSLFITMWKSNGLWSLLLKVIPQMILSCKHEVTVGQLLWLATTF